MNPIHTISGGAFRWVLQASWQAAVLAVLVLAVQLIFRKKLSPGWRYSLWLLVILRLVLPAFPQTAFSVFNFTRFAAQKPIAAQTVALQGDASARVKNDAAGVPNRLVPDESLRGNGERANGSQASVALAAPVVSAREAVKRQIDWFNVLCIAWLAGVAVMGLRVMLAGARFRSRMAKAAMVSDVDVLRLVDECAQFLGMRQRVIVIETGNVDSPSVWGLWRKRLLLPRGSLERFSAAELRHIFLHELAHLKRRDLEMNWLAGILQILHWFNPVLWFAFARMRADRELATDALALKHGSGSEDVRYGETILKVLEGLSGSPLRHGLVGIAESKARMKERLVAIVNRRAMRPWRWAAAGIAAALAVAGLTDAQQNRSKERNEAGQKQFTLRVVDVGSGAPLSGVTVDFMLDFYGGSSNKQQVITGQNGRATVKFNPDNLKHLGYEVSRAAYLRMRGNLFNQGILSIGNEFKFDMAQGTEIGGSVTDEVGKPLANAEISFDEGMNLLLSAAASPGVSEYAESWYLASGEHIAITDASGHWSAKCIWPTMQWASLRIHHPGFADVTCSTDTTSAMEAEGKGMKIAFDDLKSGKFAIKLKPGATVTGHVVDETGKAMKGIQVDCAELVTEPNRSDRLTGHYTAATDSSGQFRFEHMPPKYLYFSIQKDGYAPASAELDLKSPAASPVELRLTPGQKFLGQIVDNHDNPIPGAHVSFADFSVWRGIHWESVADANGRIEWAHAPAEKFELHIEKGGFITQNKIVQATGQETKIRVNPTLRITGQVVDAENKQPVKNFHIDWLDRFSAQEFQQPYPYVTIAGSNGAYVVDLERLYGITWGGGYAHTCLFRVQADGYAPFISRVFSSNTHDVGQVSYDIELKREAQISGQVVDGGGHPVVGAEVAVKMPGIRWLFTGSQPFLSYVNENEVRRTDASGWFRLNADSSVRGLVVASDKGFASADTNEFSTNMTIRLRPWGRLEGVVWDYDKLVTNQDVWGSLREGWPESMRVELRTNSDDHGRFAFQFVPPGKYQVYRMIPTPGGGASGGSAQVVSVEAGATAKVKLGGEGRPVIGRLDVTNPYVPIDWQNNRGFTSVRSDGPRVPEGLTPEAFEAWRNQPEIQRAFDAVRSYPMWIAADGSFRIDEMLPGKYTMNIQMYDPRDPDAMAYSKYIINTEKSFEVPESDSRVPLDIGSIDIALTAEIRKGETVAPEFEGMDMDGKKLKLSDFRGKYVLVDFWATWCGPCIGEFPYLRQVHDKFKDRKNFVMLSVSIDRTINDPRGFLKKNDLPWMQGFLGGDSGGVPSGYGAQGIPAIYLINPEGKIIETELSGGEMVERVGKRLGKPATSRTN